MKEDNKIALEHVKILRGPTQVAVDITNKCILGVYIVII